MRFTVRRIVAATAVPATVLAFGAYAAPASLASTHSTATHLTHVGQVTRVATGNWMRTAASHVTHATTVPQFRVNRLFPGKSTATTHVRGQAATTRPTVSNFDGTSGLDSANANGYDVEPPDQGMCVFPNVNLPNFYSGKLVFDIVNLAYNGYQPDGTLLFGPLTLNFLFQEPANEFLSDPRCQYDADTDTVYATVLAIDADGNHSHDDVSVLKPDGSFAVYQFDTTDGSSAGCPCFGDQPYLGYDRSNIYVGGNEFGINSNAFYGGEIYAIDKSQLASFSSTVNDATFTHLTDPDGTPSVTVQPAVTSSGTGPEYLLDIYVIDTSGNYDPADNRYNVFAITNQSAVGTGGTPTLLGPTTVTGPGYTQPTNSLGMGTTLNADDDRLQQLQFWNGKLYSTISMTSGGQDVIRYVQGKPSVSGSSVSATVSGQLISSPGNDLLYPAVFATPGNARAIVAAMNSPLIPPSAAYTTRGRFQSTFGPVTLAAAGNGPDRGFTCLPQNGRLCRYGDYSAATIDPSTRQLWMATEYTAPPTETDTNVNWGTRVFSVRG